MSVETDLLEVLDLVADDLTALGFADRVDSIRSMIESGEPEIAYSILCSNLQEFEVPLPQRAYDLLVNVWPSIRDEIRRIDGPNARLVNYVGDRGDLPPEDEPAAKPVNPPPQGKLKMPWDASPTGVTAPGSLRVHESWNLNRTTMIAFNRLVQLGVHIFPSQTGDCYTFEAPNGLYPDQMAEVEQLMEFVALKAHSKLQFIDWHPHGAKFRIYLNR